MFKMIFSLALAALLPLSVTAQVKIGVSMAAFDDVYLAAMRNGMAARVSEDKGTAVHFEDARKDIGRQISQVGTFISQGVSAIIVNPVDTSSTKRMTAAARKAKIPLVYVNRLPAEEMGDNTAYIGSDSLVAGRQQGESLVKLLGGKGNVVVIVGDLSTDPAHARLKGLKEVFAKYPGVKIVEEQTANWDRTQAIDLMSKWITAGVKFDAVAGGNDEMAIGALIAMRKGGVDPKKVLVAGVDATTDALAEMARGDLALTLYQDAKGQGRGAVDLALKMLKSEKVPDVNWIPFVLVTKENMKQFVDKN